MPLGNIKGKTVCKNCIDCEPMVNISLGERSYRCYGQNNGAPIKRDFDSIPVTSTSPDWCPNKGK